MCNVSVVCNGYNYESSVSIVVYTIVNFASLDSRLLPLDICEVLYRSLVPIIKLYNYPANYRLHTHTQVADCLSCTMDVLPYTLLVPVA